MGSVTKSFQMAWLAALEIPALTPLANVLLPPTPSLLPLPPIPPPSAAKATPFQLMLSWYPVATERPWDAIEPSAQHEQLPPHPWPEIYGHVGDTGEAKQDRTGPDRTGQDRTGQDRTGGG